MTTAIIGTGGIGSVIARRLASGGETLRLSSADTESARTLAAAIGRAAVVAADNRDALQGADAVVLALRFTVLKGVIDGIAGPLSGKLVVVPSNPLTVDARGDVSRVLPEGRSSGEVVAGWLPAWLLGRDIQPHSPIVGRVPPLQQGHSSLVNRPDDPAGAVHPRPLNATTQDGGH
jgi:predicted dinucleotide-binding enzyme